MEIVSRHGHWIAVAVLTLLGLHLMRGADPGGLNGFFGFTSFQRAPALQYAGGGVTLSEDEALVAALRASGGVRLDTITASTTENKLAHLRQGSANTAQIATGLGLEYAGVRSLATLGRAYLHVIVPADSEALAFRQLGGHRIAAGAEGSDTHRLAERLVGYLNFTVPLQLVHVGRRDLGGAFAAGEIDAAFVLDRLWAPEVDDLLATGYYRLLPVQEAQTLARMLPGVEPGVLPGGLYGPLRTLPALDGPEFKTLSVSLVLAAAHSLPDRDAHTLLAALHGPRTATHTGMPLLEPAPPLATAGILPHPGAAQFQLESAPATRGDLIAFARLLAGAGLLLLAAGFVLRQLHALHDRHKRRALRDWIEDAQDIGGRMEVAESPAELTRLVDELASKQRLAERAWLQGKLESSHTALLFDAHLVRVLSAFSRSGGPTGAFTGAGRLEHEDSEDEDLPYRIVRPDYGEAFVNTVRTREPGETRPPARQEPEAEMEAEAVPPWRQKRSEPRHWLDEEPSQHWPEPSTPTISGGLSPEDLPGDEALGPVRVRKRAPEPEEPAPVSSRDHANEEPDPADVVIVERAETAAERPQEKRKVRRKRRRAKRSKEEDPSAPETPTKDERPRRSGKGGENQMPLL